MTVTTIPVGWQVINEFANSDHIVMTIRAKCRMVNVTWAMAKDAASESTGGMANTAILSRWHMVERFTNRRNTMTGVAAFAHDVWAGMIDECANKSIGVMATATIRVCCYVGEHCGRLAGRVNAGVIVVTICTRL